MQISQPPARDSFSASSLHGPKSEIDSYLAPGFSMSLSLLEGAPVAACRALTLLDYSPAGGMQFQVLLPARSQHIVLEVGVYNEVPAVSRLCHLHLLIEGFLPFTCGHAFTHGVVSGEGGQTAPE